MKSEYLKFIKWKGNYAYFKRATIVDLLIASIPLVPALCRWLDIPEGNVLLIKCPKALRKQKVKELHKVTNKSRK